MHTRPAPHHRKDWPGGSGERDGWMERKFNDVFTHCVHLAEDIVISPP